MDRTLLAGLVLLVATPALRAQPTPAELAVDADLVAVAVVEQVDYEMTRSFPSSGSAYLRILIPYRGAERGEWIEVRERGLGEEKCYYPEPDPFAFEGARFLVLLREAEGDAVYNGVAPGCRIPVLVTHDNRYAVRYPIDGLVLPEEAVETFEFTDPAAVVDAGDFTSQQIAELERRYRARRLESGPYDPESTNYVYTLGIPLGAFRRLLELDDAPGADGDG